MKECAIIVDSPSGDKTGKDSIQLRNHDPPGVYPYQIFPDDRPDEISYHPDQAKAQ
jgi:hypothetical protein